MPSNGEICTEFGAYRSLCCGAEIVIREGATFPDCPNHPRLSTKWKSASDTNVPAAGALPGSKKKTDPAA